MPEKRHHHKKKKKWLKIVLGVFIAFIVVDAVVLAKMYYDAKKAVDTTYHKVKYKNMRKKSIQISDTDPFSVLLLGTDTGEEGRTYQGRSDTIMVAAINAKGSSLVSIPRDTLVNIEGYGQSKINAAYAYYDVAGAINTVQSYLGIPIDHYIEVNMRGLEELSAAVGPITVENDFDFTVGSNHYPKGEVTLNSKNILPYARMRYDDPRGDYGRQLRQRNVVTAMIKKIASVGSITKYQSILNAISSNMKTDLTFDQMKEIYGNYKDAMDIKQLQLQGNGQMIDGISYEVVPQENLTKVQDELKQTLEIK